MYEVNNINYKSYNKRIVVRREKAAGKIWRHNTGCIECDSDGARTSTCECRFTSPSR